MSVRLNPATRRTLAVNQPTVVTVVVGERSRRLMLLRFGSVPFFVRGSNGFALVSSLKRHTQSSFCKALHCIAVFFFLIEQLVCFFAHTPRDWLFRRCGVLSFGWLRDIDHEVHATRDGTTVVISTISILFLLVVRRGRSCGCRDGSWSSVCHIDKREQRRLGHG